MQNLKPLQLDVVTSVFDETGAKMISATRRIFYMQNWKPSQLDVVTSVFDETGAKMVSTQTNEWWGLRGEEQRMTTMPNNDHGEVAAITRSSKVERQ